MIKVPALGHIPENDWPAEAWSRKEIGERLEHWQALLVEHDAGRVNQMFSRTEILAHLDRWLDELASEMPIRCLCGDDCKEKTHA